MQEAFISADNFSSKRKSNVIFVLAGVCAVASVLSLSLLNRDVTTISSVSNISLAETAQCTAPSYDTISTAWFNGGSAYNYGWDSNVPQGYTIRSVSVCSGTIIDGIKFWIGKIDNSDMQVLGQAGNYWDSGCTTVYVQPGDYINYVYAEWGDFKNM